MKSFFTVVTYNIHRCIGNDRRKDPDRVARVIGELDPDLCALQEVEWRIHEGPDARQDHYLARLLGLKTVSGYTLTGPTECYGNAVLTRHPVTDLCLHDLSVPGREPRNALELRLDMAGVKVRFVATHLGLKAHERKIQVNRLMRIMSERRSAKPEVEILAGDLNEPGPKKANLKGIRRRMRPLPSPPTYPALLPLFPLDGIWVGSGVAFARTSISISPLTRIASDHLPIKASLRVPGQG